MNYLVPEPVKVLEKTPETPDVMTIKVNYSGLTPKPGQIYEVSVFGVGEATFSYATFDASTIQFSVKNVGKVTESLHNIEIGEYLGLRGPFGKEFDLQHMQNHNLVLIGGGIGFPPLRTVIEYVLSHRTEYKSIQLLYGARTFSDLVYKNLLKIWAEQIEVHTTIDKPESGWNGNVGVVTTLFSKIKYRDLFMIVGPEIMMKFAVKELRTMGVPESQIYLSLERKMECGIGICGHCNIGKFYVCKDGPVFNLNALKEEYEIF